MEERHIQILRKARGKLVRDLKVADILHRFPEPIFTELDEEELKAARGNRHQQTETFLDTLPRRGPRAYYAFKEALKRPYPHLFDVLEDEEEFDRERISTAETMRDLQAKLQEKTKENIKITEDLNQERENSARLALECQDLKAKLEKEKEERKKIEDERDELRKQLEEKGKTSKTTEAFP